MVNKLNRKVLTRSALLETVLNKVYELKMEPSENAEEENIEYVTVCHDLIGEALKFFLFCSKLC